ncbi:MAG: hypothetical protein ACK4OH_14020 [Acidovorax temperans]|uniref:hypothetical protein n=1 Tax=Acidovorax temperans TaxID=80878 RepID=UPI00391A7724
MKKAIATFLVALLTACAGTAFKWSDARRITAGMSIAEVTQIMGAPNTVKSADGQLIYVWVHVNGMTGSTRTLRVDFKDGKVISPPPIPDSFKD